MCTEKQMDYIEILNKTAQPEFVRASVQELDVAEACACIVYLKGQK